MTAVFAGFGLGLGVAAGFGPINVLCLTMGVRHGFPSAFAVGLGAASVDGLYAVLAGLGADAVLTGQTKGWLELVGGIALLVIAARMALASRGDVGSGDAVGHREDVRPRAAFGLSFAATAANPLTIVSWAAVFAGVVPRLELDRFETLALLPAGIVAGSLGWFAAVAAGSALVGRRVGTNALRLLSLAAAPAIAGFGLWLLVAGASTL
jgi:threonine/homoserine/homoserine lactone efflux protein